MEICEEVLLSLYPGYDSILGPYRGKDGRDRVVLSNSLKAHHEKGKTKTISYPKAIIESHINRRLNENETVDHRDRDKTNHHGNNLVIRDRDIHSSLDAIKVEVEDMICPECGSSFTPSKSQRNKQSSGEDGYPAGPFCSRVCTGKYGAKVQNGGDKLERNKIIKNYYQEEKE